MKKIKLEVGMSFKTREKGYGVIVPCIEDEEGITVPSSERNFHHDGRYWADDFGETLTSLLDPPWDIMELYQGNKLIWKRED